jgi:hypothetical protein
MNDYEQRQEDKRERLRAKATRLRQQASALHREGWERLEAIPFGQPILIGHHSEQSDRSYRARAVGKIDKSSELANAADELESRADRMGSGGISSGDPDAIAKLDDKLLKAEEAHALMVERNREAKALGQQKPYLAWQISNSRGRISQIKYRIQGLQHIALQSGVQPIEGNGWKMREDRDENRIMFIFDELPSEAHRSLLKSRAFKWSPMRKAWVRQITPSARFATQQIIETLRGL